MRFQFDLAKGRRQWRQRRKRSGLVSTSGYPTIWSKDHEQARRRRRKVVD